MTKTAILFPGQGAQSVGMARALCSELPAADQLFDQASAVVGYDLRQLCFEGPPERLNSTENSQPALFVASLAALEKLRCDTPELIDEATATAGLSLGEITALVFAEAITFDDGLRLVAERGQAMQAASDLAPSGMVSVLGLEQQEIEQLCDEARQTQVLQIANLLCPGNIVVSGHLEACERLAVLAEAAGAMRVVPLPVAGAFHTPLMQPAVERLQAALDRIQIRTPRIPVVGNVHARPHTDPDSIRAALAEQVVAPVRWEDSMRALIQEHGIERFCEVGPGRVLRGLLKRIARKVPCENVAA